ncbi:MAG: sigma-54-dependent Fis family transcriptional regulator [Nitrospirae bacterium]|nr:sigma-54-dependent Fis family transcriptional regulator [Nitrospirota bacterium]
MLQKLLHKVPKGSLKIKQLKILIIEDEPTVRLGLSCTLEGRGCRVLTAENGVDGIRLFEKEGFDIVITDLRLPGADGIEVLKSIKNISPDTGVIIITAFADVKNAVEAMREGAYDYISKPFDAEELLIVIERYVKYRGIELENIRLKEELREQKQFQNIIAISPAMQSVFETIEAAAKTDSSILIYGESGTGKELVANAIHNLSPKRDNPFIKINCAAIPETLLESELFGHEKGAFTGAIHRKKGKFEVADTGTIFFDEISEMPVSLQAKMLRVIEDHTFERLGGNEPIHVEVRTLFATCKNLKDEIKADKFREDLYYRINVLPITVSPLRERKEDIPLLVEHFLKIFSKKTGRSGLIITPSAMQRLLAYDYPGNVRELKHAIEMVVTLCKGRTIDLCCLPAEMRGSRTRENIIPVTCENLTLEEKLRDFEKETIVQMLEYTEGKKNKAAKRLGISRKTLWKKLKEYGFPVSPTELEDEE